jgi:hypothetical protein
MERELVQPPFSETAANVTQFAAIRLLIVVICRDLPETARPRAAWV